MPCTAGHFKPILEAEASELAQLTLDCELPAVHVNSHVCMIMCSKGFINCHLLLWVRYEQAAHYVACNGEVVEILETSM